MSIETRSNNQNRKRGRQNNLNQSIPPVLPKIRKTDTIKARMSKPDRSNDNQIIDMSHTINQTANTRRENAVIVPGASREEEITPEMRNLVSDEVTRVQRSLEDKVKELVQTEMAETRKMIEQLTRCVENLTSNTTVRTNIGISEHSGTDSGNPRDSDTSPQNQNQSSNLSHSRTSSENTANNRHLLLPIQGGINPGQNHHNFEVPRIRMDKLGINFDGNPANLNIDDFVFRLEHLQRHYQIPWGEVLRDFHLLMAGSAKEWYWLYIKTHGVVDWAGLRHALLAQFQVTRSNFEIMRDLVERKQQSGESVDAYFQVMCQIRSKLVQPIPEYDMIKIIKRNIKESIGRIVYPISVSSVEQLRVECNEAEKHFPRRELRPMQPPTRPHRHINEIYYEDNDYDEKDRECSPQRDNYEEVCAMSVNPQHRKQPVICWNCKQQGHVYMDCVSTERHLFCYKCGRPNVITPRCPNCQSGNQSRSLAGKGDPGSAVSQTPKSN